MLVSSIILVFVGSFTVSASKLVLSLDVFSRPRFIGPQVYEVGLFRVSEFGSHVLLRAKVSKKGGKYVVY